MILTVAPEPCPRRVRARGAPLLLAAPLLCALAVAGGCESSPLQGVTPALQDDSPLSRDVLAALAERPELARFSISVRSLGEGTVRLSGHVDDEASKHVAERAAVAVPGVRSVVNTLYVRR